MPRQARKKSEKEYIEEDNELIDLDFVFTIISKEDFVSYIKKER